MISQKAGGGKAVGKKKKDENQVWKKPEIAGGKPIKIINI